MSDEFDKLAEKIGVVVQGGSVSIGSVNVYKSPPALLVGIPQNLPYSGAVEFVGRFDELETLHQQLQRTDRVVISAVSGMGGVGKTELALQYALQHIKDYTGGVCWLRARTANLGVQILEFAQLHLNLEIPQELGGRILELEQQVKWCWQHWQPDGVVLFIFDDVTELANCREMLQELPKRFRVLITTRQRKLDASFSELSLDVLSPAASLNLLIALVGKTRIEREQQIGENLCEWLGYLPLGLELVGRYLAEDPDLSLVKMLERLEAQRLKDEALDLNEQQTQEKYMITAQRGVRAAFELTWQELIKPVLRKPSFLRRFTLGQKLFNQSSPDASDLALLLSLLAPDVIPWSLVELATGALKWSSSEVENLRKRLYKTHLIQQVALNSYKIHPLIHKFLREKLEISNTSSNLKKNVVNMMATLAKQIPSILTSQQIQEISSTIPHMGEVATMTTSFLKNENLIWPFTGIARFYNSQGFYSVAGFWYEKCLEQVQNRFGYMHVDVAQSLGNLAGNYAERELYEKAELFYIESLNLYKKLLGEDHELTATGLSNLAWIYKLQERLDESESMYLKSLQVRQQLLGENHPDTALTLHNLSCTYSAQERYEEAEELNIHAIRIWEQTLGQSHPLFATGLFNLANLYKIQNRYEEAEPLYLQVLEVRKHILGDRHLDTARILDSLADLYQSQERHNEAEPLYLQAFEIKKNILGDNHPEIARQLSSLAHLYWEIEVDNKAEFYWLQALAIQQEQLDGKHPHIAMILANLANLYLREKRFGEAASYFQNALEVWGSNLPENFNEVSACLTDLARCYEFQNRYNEAEATYQRVTELIEQTLNVESLPLAEQFLYLADIFESQKRDTDAESLYKKALQIAQRQVDLNAPQLTPFLNNFGIFYYKQKKYTEAESLYRQVLEVNRQAFGLEHEDVGLSLHNLAALYDDQNRLDEAVAFCIQAQQIWEKTIGVEDPLYARSLDRLAGIYKRQNKLSEARSLYEQALTIREKKLGMEHSDTQSTRQSLKELFRP